MPSKSKKESLSPQLELCATITSIEGVPNLPTTSSSSTMVAGRKINEGNVGLLFKDAENMTQVVGVGFEWAKVVVTKDLDVEVREIGEHVWKGLWEDQGCEELELIDIILPQLESKVGGSLDTRLEDQIERFEIGLTKSDVIGVYAENHLEQLNEGFSPLVYDLVQYMGLEGENTIRCRQVSGGEGGSSNGAAKVRCSTDQTKGKKMCIKIHPKIHLKMALKMAFKVHCKVPLSPCLHCHWIWRKKRFFLSLLFHYGATSLMDRVGKRFMMATNYIRQQLCLSSNLCLKWMEAIGR
jgi:hypothetical protein